MLTEDSRAVTSAPSPSASPSPSAAGAKLRPGSKWGRLLGSSSVDSASDGSTKVAVSRSLSARESLRESAQARATSIPSTNGGGQGNKVVKLTYFLSSFIKKFKVFPKSVKLSPGPASLTRQDTIEEGGEGEVTGQSRDTAHRSSIQLEHKPQPPSERTSKTERDPLLDAHEKERAKERLERNLSLERERQIEMAKARETTSDSYDTGLREQPSTLAQRDLISTVLDMKVDVRLEMQRMSQRISRIEDLLTDLVNRLVVDSSDQSSPGDTTTSQASTVVSPTGTATIAISTSSASLTPSGPNISGVGTGGNGLGPILLRKRRSKAKNRKPPAPAPPMSMQLTESEETRLIDSDIPSTSTSSTRKREFL